MNKEKCSISPYEDLTWKCNKGINASISYLAKLYRALIGVNSVYRHKYRYPGHLRDIPPRPVNITS